MEAILCRACPYVEKNHEYYIVALVSYEPGAHGCVIAIGSNHNNNINGVLKLQKGRFTTRRECRKLGSGDEETTSTASSEVNGT